MTFQCYCICTKECREAMEDGRKQFVLRTGRNLEIQWFQTCSELYQRLSAGSCDVVIVAIPGAAGMEIATRSRELLPHTPLVWCSDDKDFAIHSYRLRTAMFLQLPVNAGEIDGALGRCLEPAE